MVKKFTPVNPVTLDTMQVPSKYSPKKKSTVEPNHYKKFKMEPFDFIHKNNLGFAEGNVIKYICRWREKNGVEDLKKAIRYIELLIEGEENETEN